MDAVYLKAFALGVVEGLTEFLPISSTGHLVIAGQLLGFDGEKAKVFDVAIQLAAILAVCWEFRARLVAALAGCAHEPAQRRFLANLAIAFAPAALLGFAFHGAIKAYLFQPLPVAAALVLGGLAILWVERRKRRVTIPEVEDLGWRDALKIGCVQALALVPGTSRAGATIIGALYFGMSRRAATEFSFFLAIPTMFAAVGYDLYRNRALLGADDLGVFAVGFAASFASAFVAVRGLLAYISRHDFTVFAWYRIGFGLFVLATAYTGVVDWSPKG
jgi:undecaprenyl-diphosphatase